jgi:hypothetical protein
MSEDAQDPRLSRVSKAILGIVGIVSTAILGIAGIALACTTLINNGVSLHDTWCNNIGTFCTTDQTTRVAPPPVAPPPVVPTAVVPNPVVPNPPIPAAPSGQATEAPPTADQIRALKEDKIDCAAKVIPPDLAVICRSAKLADLDAQLVKLFKASPPKVRASEDDFIKLRAGCGSNEGCIVGAYIGRIGELQSQQ